GVGKKFTEGRTQEQWVKHTMAESAREIPELPSYEKLKEMGVWKRAGGVGNPAEGVPRGPGSQPARNPVRADRDLLRGAREATQGVGVPERRTW
ncbi:hypothetical protein, partial [Corynebacterium sp.]